MQFVSIVITFNVLISARIKFKWQLLNTSIIDKQTQALQKQKLGAKVIVAAWVYTKKWIES